MKINIKKQNKDLCFHCREAFITENENGKIRKYCTARAMEHLPIPEEVRSCNQYRSYLYYDKYSGYASLGWVLELKNNNVGFRPPSKNEQK